MPSSEFSGVVEPVQLSLYKCSNWVRMTKLVSVICVCTSSGMLNVDNEVLPQKYTKY